MFSAKKLILNPSVTGTLIGEGSLFEGTIKSEASLRIEGRVTGDIVCSEDITVGEGGFVQSDMCARNVILAGTVHGNITVNEKLTITATGQLSGNIRTQLFVIEEGGVFHGASMMEGKNGGTIAEPANKDGVVKPFPAEYGDTPAAI